MCRVQYCSSCERIERECSASVNLWVDSTVCKCYAHPRHRFIHFTYVYNSTKFHEPRTFRSHPTHKQAQETSCNIQSRKFFLSAIVFISTFSLLPNNPLKVVKYDVTELSCSKAATFMFSRLIFYASYTKSKH